MTAGVLPLLVILGLWATLDTSAVGQFMVSRPLVTGILAGMALGAPLEGAIVGGLLELIHLGAVPAGGARLPEPGVGGVVGAAAVSLHGGAEGLALGLGLGLLVSWLGGWTQTLQRRLNGRLVARARTLPGVHLRCISSDALRGGLLTAAGLAAVVAIPDTWIQAWPASSGQTMAAAGAAGALALGQLLKITGLRWARHRNTGGGASGHAASDYSVSGSKAPIGPTIRIVARSFLVQATWNERTRLGAGLAWILEGTGREDIEPEDSDDLAARRGAEAPRGDGAGRGDGLDDTPAASPSFNAHPYLVPLVAGAVTRMDAEGASNEEKSRLRNALQGPLGALGDRLVWAGWQPLTLLLAGAALLVGLPPVWAMAGFLVAYNAGHLTLRIWGAVAGLRSGRHVAQALGRMGLGPRAHRIQQGVLISGALLAGLLLAALWTNGDVHWGWGVVGGLALCVGVLRGTKLSAPTSGALALLFLALLGLMGGA